ncbi:ROK family transcriptional regulator [Bacillus luti]|uniref:ROK family protein n=1 Tax=Bacillus luti TaxID=2026191 RepID=A0A7V7V481_9BACI|nr:ROK family protein [Bacillus luti]KAB2440922.1 ROK family protein [Bacillus luti]
MSEQFVTQKSIKETILRGIRTALLERGSATKVELSNTLEISFPTISKFIEKMKQDGEVTLAGLDDSSGGRRAKRYEYNPEYMLGLAIFLERNETNYTIFNCLGEVKEQGSTSSVLMDTGLDVLTKHIENLIATFPKISSISIGVPGAVDNGRIFYIPGYEKFQNFNLKSHLEDLFFIPVVIENDMNAAVLGYHKNTGNYDNSSLVYLYAGQNGPGAGIMVNGDVVRGSTFFSGEISFVPQYDNKNFLQALRSGEEVNLNNREEYNIDAITRLISTFIAIINPHAFIFCDDEVNQFVIDQIVKNCPQYIPAEHIPKITVSNWKEDYLYGLKSLGLDLMITKTKKEN